MVENVNIYIASDCHRVGEPSIIRAIYVDFDVYY